MTLLPPNKVQGPSIQLPDGRWMDAPGIRRRLRGQWRRHLHRWTNERFLSTPHRVRNVSGPAALRRAVLLRPRPTTPVIECLPTCGPAEISADQVRRLRNGSPPSATSTCRSAERRPRPISPRREPLLRGGDARAVGRGGRLLFAAPQSRSNPGRCARGHAFDLKVLDPIWTTANIVRNHGYMV